MKAADELAKHVGVKPACAALEVSPIDVVPSSRPINRATAAPPDARPGIERDGTRRGLRHAVFGAVRGPLTAAEVVATLLDEEVYLCSERTMYRVLASEVPVQERRAQRTHPEYKKPELMATAPEPGVVLGYHAAARAEEVELLLPLRHHGHLQPLRRGLDGGGPGELGPGRPVDPAELPEAWRPSPGS